MFIRLIYFIFLALIHAEWEIQIEGKDGWAKNLPCWHIKWWDGKEITGYHLFMLLFLLGVFHSIFLFHPWTIYLELKVIALLLWYLILEDFLWFVLNKHYGIQCFCKGRIEWHRIWFLKVPLVYWLLCSLGFLLFFWKDLI